MIKLNFITAIAENPKTAVVAIPAILATNLVVDFKAMAMVLLYMFCIDLFTGILASYYDWRKNPLRKESWFFGKGEGFSSSKFKKMISKAIAYILLPFLIIQFQHILKIKNVKYETISDAEFELATIALIIFCLNEGFSIFHENLPRCGFNLWERIKTMIGFYKQVKTEFKDE